MVDSVPYEVHQWIADLLDHGLVDFGLLSPDDQFHFFPKRSGQISNHSRKTAEYGFDRDHSRAQTCRLQFFCDETQPGGREIQRCVEPLHAGLAGRDVLTQLRKTVSFEHKFADQVHEVVEFPHVDSHRCAFGNCRRYPLFRQRMFYLRRGRESSLHKHLAELFALLFGLLQCRLKLCRIDDRLSREDFTQLLNRLPAPRQSRPATACCRSPDPDAPEYPAACAAPGRILAEVRR